MSNLVLFDLPLRRIGTTPNLTLLLLPEGRIGTTPNVTLLILPEGRRSLACRRWAAQQSFVCQALRSSDVLHQTQRVVNSGVGITRGHCVTDAKQLETSLRMGHQILRLARDQIVLLDRAAVARQGA